MAAYLDPLASLDCTQIPSGQPRRDFCNLQSRVKTTAPALTRREPSFAARGTIAAVAGCQNMALIAHARTAALGRLRAFNVRHSWRSVSLKTPRFSA